MSDANSSLDDPDLGPLHRATSELEDGSVLTHDWFVGSVEADGSSYELMVEGASPDEVAPLLPRLRTVVADTPRLRRVASDAVVTTFSTGDPDPTELDEATDDLDLETIEAAADGTVVLHFTDTCGEHFPEGYWPAVHLDAEDAVATVTVES
ncbi:hypothetical protein [Microbacterium sp. 1S1]|uniref:hypothetical protein n=1 Tax=Microbacterium sp. 1S1 TaxID=2606451 RepID=UPI0011EB5BCF|nr:hypothetical protein [Microbacterium sp. 1S1]